MKTEIIATKLQTNTLTMDGTKEKTLYYLTIGTGEKKLILNVGEKTYNTIKQMEEEKIIPKK